MDYDLENGKIIRKVTYVGLIINLLLAGFKFFAGVVGSSQALVADAIHSLSDASTDIAVIIGSFYWSKPADQEHPYGHRRIETLVTVFIGFILLGAGVEIIREAFLAYGKNGRTPPGWFAFWAAAASILSKEVLYKWTSRVGKKARSAALIANAWHHRTDALSSVLVIFAVGGTLICPSWTFLDSVGASMVSILIIHMSLKIIIPGLKELIDSGAPPDACEKIKALASRNRDVVHVHKIRTRYIGSSLLVDMHIVVDGQITVEKGHDIAEKVKSLILREEPDVIDVIVHVDPSTIGGFKDACT